METILILTQLIHTPNITTISPFNTEYIIKYELHGMLQQQMIIQEQLRWYVSNDESNKPADIKFDELYS